MSIITICEHCKALIFAGTEQHKCRECDGIFCSLDCLYEHRCCGLPKLIIPWEEDEKSDKDFDIVEILKSIVQPERAAKSRDKDKVECLYCHQENGLVWCDIDLGVLCRDCYKKLRAEFLEKINLKYDCYNILIPGFRIIRLTKLNMQSEYLMALIMAKMKLEKRRYIYVTLETRNDTNKVRFELHDFRVWHINETTIMYVGKKIFEFIPGMYLIIRDKQ